ncbi:MAG: hypothetical protein DI533_13665 [Cereibacter sphaeroides]|uniref:Endonuclease/exonuclease/phosphatase domain-containing protein n=1 Tax=Cereibacter sphaeroides TaxID=1063 RepID=A0A2W5U0G0_CERSP|nr:MAG: hypothetical protein DI533_13665 [Cereibacter sphaeroides]
MRGLAPCTALLLVGVVLVSFTGWLFAPGDSAAVIRPQAGALLIPLGLCLWTMRLRRVAVVSLVAAILALGSVVPGFLAPDAKCSGDCLILYQKNLLSKAWPRYPLADEIIGSGAQIVTLQEVSDHNRHFMAPLFDYYPVAVTCAFRPAQDVVVLTSLPVVEGSQFCLDGAGLAGVQVEAPDGRLIWALSVHLPWPYPFDQFRQSRLIAARIGDMQGPILIGGDFNMVPWGASVRRIAQAAASRYLGPFRNTFNLGGWYLPLPQDMVLIPQGSGGSVELRPYNGSDHLGVLAQIDLR